MVINIINIVIMIVIMIIKWQFIAWKIVHLI